MEIRIQRIFLKYSLIGLLSLSSFQILAVEQEEEVESGISNIKVFDPQVERREVDKDAIDTENWEIGLYYGVISIEDFGANDIVGGTISYHVTEDLFFSANYGETEADLTSAEILTGISVLSGDREYKHYDLSLGFNILPGEGFLGKDIAFTSNFYLLAGLGSTNFAGDNHSTAVVGGGYQVLFNDWFSLNLAVRDYIYKIEIVGSKTASDLEISTGFTIFF
ncbi:outer membrane beta-barrel domain-containing protein [Aliikangiella sp. IMCC44359]|uniref:outer membrane beta-barrel domain-containing protein n=1 Tax=Aliikangiella sp. IMCC44359 TaxID=3459125 RepID=UPI00403AC9E8